MTVSVHFSNETPMLMMRPCVVCSGKVNSSTRLLIPTFLLASPEASLDGIPVLLTYYSSTIIIKNSQSKQHRTNVRILVIHNVGITMAGMRLLIRECCFYKIQTVIGRLCYR